MKRIAIVLVSLIAAWLTLTFGYDRLAVHVSSLAWIAVLEVLLIALATTLHNIDLKAKIDRRVSAAAAILLVLLFVAGCATSTAPVPTAATPKNDYGLPCITSNWMYAWIDECGEGPTVRITWVEYYALQLADKIAEMREP